MKSSVQNSYFTRIISIIQEFGCFYERLYCIIFQQKEKKCQESCFSGTSGNSGGDGEANSIPQGSGLEKRPGISGNRFLGFPCHPYASDEYYTREYWIELTLKNISDCNYDGGDCCGDDVNISYCSDCTCNENPCEGMNE